MADSGNRASDKVHQRILRIQNYVQITLGSMAAIAGLVGLTCMMFGWYDIREELAIGLVCGGLYVATGFDITEALRRVNGLARR